MTTPVPLSKYVIASLAAAGMVLALGGSAQAHKGKRGKRGKRCVPVFLKAEHAKFDKNKDGKLSRPERRAMMEARHAAALAKYDENGNGELDKNELKKLRYDKMVEHFEALDANRDAEISRAEAKGSCTRLEFRFDDVDDDGNGSVSWTEFEQSAPPHPPRGRFGPRHGPCGGPDCGHGPHGPHGGYGPPDDGDAE